MKDEIETHVNWKETVRQLQMGDVRWEPDNHEFEKYIWIGDLSIFPRLHNHDENVYRKVEINQNDQGSAGFWQKLEKEANQNGCLIAIEEISVFVYTHVELGSLIDDDRCFIKGIVFDGEALSHEGKIRVAHKLPINAFIKNNHIA